MRGFTMLLVVSCHVTNICFNPDADELPFIFGNLFQQFRMPLFFFISGFVLYSAKRTWSTAEIVQFFKKKIPVQLLFPAFCMVVCMLVTHYKSIGEAIWDVYKGGYWFTFVLLEFYVMYIAMQLLLRPLRNRLAADIIQVAAALAVFPGMKVLWHYQISLYQQDTLFSLFSVAKFDLFIFFVLGTLARKHFARLERCMDNNLFILSCLAVYLFFNIFNPRQTVLILGTGVSGIMIVFMFFRRYQHSFAADRRLGAVMQYVGRRTLDIYLLHYLFIFTNDLTGLKQVFNGSSVLELCCSLLFSFIVIGLSLILSNILRMSPFISKYCFGVKQDKEN